MDKLNLEQKIENLQSEISSLKNKEKNFNRKLLKFVKLTGAFGIFCGSLLAFAQVIASLHVFNSGEVISATKINENFAYLDNKINSVAAGGLITQALPTHSTIALGASDSGKLFSVSSTAVFQLPSVSDITAGYNFKLSINEGGQVLINNNSGAGFDGYTQSHIFVGVNSTFSGGYIEVLYTGSNWITPISTNTSTTEVDPSRIAAVTCDGKSVGAANCYNNATATDTVNFGFVYIDNYLFTYDGSVWYQVAGSSKYLINDPTNLLAGVEYTNKWSIASATLNNVGGITYVISSGTYNLSNMLNSETTYLNHAGVNNPNYINEIIFANFAYISTDGATYYNGSNCQQEFGGDWRLPTLAQGGTIGANPGVNFWTASATGNANEYDYIDASGSVLQTTDHYMNYYYLVCVFQP